MSNSPAQRGQDSSPEGLLGGGGLSVRQLGQNLKIPLGMPPPGTAPARRSEDAVLSEEVAPAKLSHPARDRVHVKRKAPPRRRPRAKQVAAEQKTEQERPTVGEAEQERVAAVTKAEQARVAAEEAEQERIAGEKAERERRVAEEAEIARLGSEEAERERVAAVTKAEQARVAAEEAEQERIAGEKAERERRVAEEAEIARLGSEEAERERVAAEQIAEQERIAAENAERERVAAEEARMATEDTPGPGAVSAIPERVRQSQRSERVEATQQSEVWQRPLAPRKAPGYTSGREGSSGRSGRQAGISSGNLDQLGHSPATWSHSMTEDEAAEEAEEARMAIEDTPGPGAVSAIPERVRQSQRSERVEATQQSEVWQRPLAPRKAPGYTSGREGSSGRSGRQAGISSGNLDQLGHSPATWSHSMTEDEAASKICALLKGHAMRKGFVRHLKEKEAARSVRTAMLSELQTTEELARVFGIMRQTPQDVEIHAAGIRRLRHLIAGDRIAAAVAIETTLREMAEYPDSEAVQNSCCTVLKFLSGSSEVLRAEMASAGAINALLWSMGAQIASARVQEHGCIALYNLALNCPSRAARMVTAGAIITVQAVQRAHQGTLTVANEASDLLDILTQAQKQRAATLSELETAWPARAVALLRQTSEDAEIQAAGCKRLNNLAASDDELKVKVASAGGIEAVVHSMRAHAGSMAVQEKGCAALAHLADGSDALCNAVACAGAVDVVLCGMKAHAHSAVVQEHGCIALYNLAYESRSRTALIKAAGAVRVVEKARHAHRASPAGEEASDLLQILSSSS